MKWRKRGHVYAPSGDAWWARTHAFIPSAEVVNGGRVRVYYTGLDAERYGRVGYVDLDADDPTRVLGHSAEPVLDLGELGAFDDCGVNASCVVTTDGVKHLYYIGWQRAARVPYMLFSGLATSRDGGQTFQRHSRVPVLDRTAAEPFSRSAPCVRVDGGRYEMWYWSCVRWSDEGDGVHYNNVIRFAESADGVSWVARPAPVLTLDDPDDYSAGRPWVVRDSGGYRMWYSIRSRTRPYRIGYAESADGVAWTRRDELAGLERSAAGWDSEMVCFPCVVDAGGRRLMFYNGNRHGATGFGVAELESD